MNRVFFCLALVLCLCVDGFATNGPFADRYSRATRQGEANARLALIHPSKTQPYVFTLSEAPSAPNIDLSTLPIQERQAYADFVRGTLRAFVQYDAKTLRPVFISGERLSSAANLLTTDDIQQSTSAFLQSIGSMFGIVDAHSELQNIHIDRDALGQTHVRVQQQYSGIPIWGTEAIVHYNARGEVVCFNGRLQPTPLNVNLQVSVTASTACATALNDLAQVTAVSALSSTAQSILGYTGPIVEKVFFPDRHNADQVTLAWHLTVRPNLIERWEYFINCDDNTVIFKYNNTCADGPATAQAVDLRNTTTTVNSYNFQSSFYLIDATRAMFNSASSKFPNQTVGSIWTIDARNTDLTDIFNVISPSNAWNDKSSVSAHSNSAMTYEYYRTTHNRSSIDGAGGTIISVIHVTQGGQSMDNAYWNGKLMAYGDGRNEFKALAGAIDVAAHEMTHGVTENTAGLVYLSQAGAINESMSDVFGCLVERKNWKIGEDVVKPGVFAGGALRDMADPHNGAANVNQAGWQPAHMNEYMTLPETQDGDNGGVHVNSGIPNKAAFLIQNSIGMAKTEKIYYRTLTLYLTKNSQFIDLRRAAVKSAQDLFTATEVNAVKAAFDAVGILDGSATNTDNTQPPVNGTEWILLHNTDFNADPNSLYIVKPVSPQSSDFHPISKTPLNRRPSVVDNGTFAVFVANDLTLHAITLDVNSPVETILSAEPVWENVAISRDGKRMAAISSTADSSIYIFDFDKTPTTSKRFILYSPTSAQGIKNFNVPYADAIEWDYSGKYVLFDALNRIENGQGDTVEYFNVGVLRAYNPAVKSYDDGSIFTIFPSLPDGVSVGNPTFSKNSPNVVAMDLYNDNTKGYAVLASNIETSDTKVLVDNNTSLGYPSYGKNDDKLAYVTLDNSGTSIVNILPLAGDKISSSGAAVFLASDAEFPVFYTVGSRPVEVRSTEQETSTMTIVPNPVSGRAQVEFTCPVEGTMHLSVCDVLGNEIQFVTDSWVSAGLQRQAVDMDSLQNGLYIMRLRIGNTVQSVHVLVNH